LERNNSAGLIAELFQFFLEHPDRLPESYSESAEPLHRQVCDYIAGMTDGYFRKIYQQMIRAIPQVAG
jgi:dGTPase